MSDAKLNHLVGKLANEFEITESSSANVELLKTNLLIKHREYKRIPISTLTENVTASLDVFLQKKSKEVEQTSSSDVKAKKRKIETTIKKTPSQILLNDGSVTPQVLIDIFYCTMVSNIICYDLY
jgi:ABC-type ATPase involved in cell division